MPLIWFSAPSSSSFEMCRLCSPVFPALQLDIHTVLVFYEKIPAAVFPAHGQVPGVIFYDRLHCVPAVVPPVLDHARIASDIRKMSSDILLCHDKAVIPDFLQIFRLKILFPVEGDITALNLFR